MFKQLKQKYLLSFDEKISSINQALESDDAQALSVLIHQMAGSSGSYGFDDISSLCIEIEDIMHDTQIINETVTNKTDLLVAKLQRLMDAAA